MLVFELKMGVGGENRGNFPEFLGVILIFELKTGILGKIGHLVFCGKRGCEMGLSSYFIRV